MQIEIFQFNVVDALISKSHMLQYRHSQIMFLFFHFFFNQTKTLMQSFIPGDCLEMSSCLKSWVHHFCLCVSFFFFGLVLLLVKGLILISSQASLRITARLLFGLNCKPFLLILQIAIPLTYIWTHTQRVTYCLLWRQKKELGNILLFRFSILLFSFPLKFSFCFKHWFFSVVGVWLILKLSLAL